MLPLRKLELLHTVLYTVQQQIYETILDPDFPLWDWCIHGVLEIINFNDSQLKPIKLNSCLDCYSDSLLAYHVTPILLGGCKQYNINTSHFIANGQLVS